MKKIIILLLTILILSVSTIAYAANATAAQARKAVKNVAMAFYYKGNLAQYDQKKLIQHDIIEHGWLKHSYLITPEDITSKDNQFMDCSNFAYVVYKNAFKDYTLKNGTNGEAKQGWDIFIMGYPGIAGYRSDLAVLYYEGDNLSSRKNAIRTEMENNLKVGDIVAIWRSTGTGHIIMYLGGEDKSFIHSTGADYNRTAKKEKYEPNGTVRIYSGDRMFNDVIFKGTVNKIAVIRPINEIAGKKELSSASLIRDEYPALVSEKTASIGLYDSLNPGESITYTIRLENKSTDVYSGLKITDKVPEYTEFVSIDAEGSHNNGDILFDNITLSGESVKEFRYTVRVAEDTPLNTYFRANSGKINDDLRLGYNNYTLVNRTFTSGEQALITSKVRNLEGTEATNFKTFFSEVFDGLELDLSQNLFSALFDTTTKTYDGNTFTLYNFNPSKTKKYSKLYVNRLIGGLNTLETTGATTRDTGTMGNDSDIPDRKSRIYTRLSDRVRFPKADCFTVGDILLVYDKNQATDLANGIPVYFGKNLYLYIGNSNFALVQNQTVTITSSESGDRLINSLLGQESFIVLRPSFNTNVTIKAESGGEESTNTVTIKYVYAYGEKSGETIADSVADEYSSGESFFYESPTIDYYTADRVIVSGEVTNTDIIEFVRYSPINDENDNGIADEIEEIEHTEHTLVITEEIPATCETPGVAEYWTCSVCGKLFVYSEGEGEEEISEPLVIPALGHISGDVVIENNIPATYEEAGSYDEVIYCTRCEEELSRKHNIVEPIVIMKGDLDDDKQITIYDVRLLLQEYINSGNSKVWSEEDLARMDMDGNETIDIIDVRLLLQLYINS